MAFVHGSKAKVYANGYDLSPFLRSFSFPASIDSAETSTFGNTFKTYVPGLTDFTITAEGIYDGATGAVDEAFQAALNSTTDDTFMFFPQGDTFALPGFGAVVVTTSLQVSAELGNVSQISFQGQGDQSIDRLLSLVALAAQGAAFTGQAINNGASSAGGGAFYVEQTAAAAGVTYKVQDSADGVTFADIAASSIALASGRAAGRVSFTGTVRQYVRVTSSGASTFVAGFARK